MPAQTSEQEQLFHKIRSLLRKAESTTFEEEAKTFFQKAQALMLKYRIDESALWASDPSKRQAIETIEVGIRDKQPGAHFKHLILNKIANLSQCSMYYMPGKDTSKVVGFPQDLVWVDLLYTSIMSQATFASARALAVENATGNRINTRTFRNNFYRGFEARITHRLEETYRAAKLEVEEFSGSTDLVLADRKAQVETWLRNNVRLGRGHQTSGGKYNEAAARHGTFAADTTDISGGRGSVTTKPRGELNG